MQKVSYLKFINFFSINLLRSFVFFATEAKWRKYIPTRYTSARQYVKPYEKKPREQSSRTVTWQSADFQTKFVRLSIQVGYDATVGRLSNNCFLRYQVIGRIFEKSRWTVTRQWSEVTRLSADCQTTFFRRFKQLEIFFEKSRWTVTRQWSEVTRPSADCQTTFFGRSNRFGKILKKVAERSRDSGWGHATVGRLSNNVFWTFQAFQAGLITWLIGSDRSGTCVGPLM